MSSCGSAPMPRGKSEATRAKKATVSTASSGWRQARRRSRAIAQENPPEKEPWHLGEPGGAGTHRPLHLTPAAVRAPPRRRARGGGAWQRVRARPVKDGGRASARKSAWPASSSAVSGSSSTQSLGGVQRQPRQSDATALARGQASRGQPAALFEADRGERLEALAGRADPLREGAARIRDSPRRSDRPSGPQGGPNRPCRRACARDRSLEDSPCQRISALVGSREPRHAAKQRRLPAAVRAAHAEQLPAGDLEGDAREEQGGPAAAREVADLAGRPGRRCGVWPSSMPRERPCR